MAETLLRTAPEAIIDDSAGPHTEASGPRHNVQLIDDDEGENTEGLDSTSYPQQYAWSEGYDPMPQNYSELSDQEKDDYKRILSYDPHAQEVIIAPIPEERIKDLEKKIEEAPNLDAAIEVIDELHDTDFFHVVKLLEKIHEQYSNSQDATERIDKIIADNTDAAEQAITGQHHSATPQTGVEGLVKAYTLATDPQIKKHIRVTLEAAVKTAAANAFIDGEPSALDPQVAEVALEVVEDLKHVSPREEVDAEILLRSHAEEDSLRQEMEDLAVEMAAKQARIDELREQRAKEMRGKATPMTAVSNLLRFSR